jgi:hypothetical protein
VAGRDEVIDPVLSLIPDLGSLDSLLLASRIVAASSAHSHLLRRQVEFWMRRNPTLAVAVSSSFESSGNAALVAIAPSFSDRT